MQPMFRERVCLLALALLGPGAAGLPLAADDSLDARLELAEGVRVSLVAEHPQVVTPTGIDVDDRGGVWVVASHTHFRPEDYEGPEHDEVVVLRDGKRQVFMAETTATMDLELGPDGWVYLAERSRLLRARDRDGDGVADQTQQLARLETAADYPHNGMAGLSWKDDGRLLFTLGENYANDWKLTGADGTAIRGSGEGGVFEIAPDGRGLRRIARGFWNPFGACVLPSDEVFVCENDPGARPPCRLLHVVEGGDYGYQRHFGPAPFHPFVCWNGELRGTLPMAAPVGEAPCGLLPLGGGLLVTSWSDNRIDYHRLRPRGASYATERQTVVAGSDVFRPTCIAAANEPGVFYFADWTVGSYQLTGKGRVWKLEVADDAPWRAPPIANPQAASAARLRAGTPDAADAPSRGAADSIDQLLRTASSSEDPFVAQAALVALSKRPEPLTVEQFAQRSVAERTAAALAIKFHFAARLDHRVPGGSNDPLRDRLLRALLADSSPEVRFEALRWIAEERLPGFREEVRQVLEDPTLDFAMFEAALAAWNSVNGRAAAGVSDPEMLLERVQDEQAPPRLRAFALRLISPQHAKLEPAMLARFAESPHTSLSREAVRSLAAQPTPAARDVLQRLCLDPQVPVERKLDAILGLSGAAAEHWDCLSQLAQSDHRSLREEALRAMRFAKHPDKAALLQRLAEQHPESRDLIAAAADPATLAAGRPAPDELELWQRRLEETPGTADPAAGRRVFFNAAVGMCSNCHRHEGRGNVVGPDLSALAAGAGEDPTARVLQSLLEPSRDVAPQYHPWRLRTEDGVVFTGIMLRNGGSGRVVFRDDQGRERTIDMSKVEERREVPTSMMPERLVHQLTDRELRDLLAFLLRRATADAPR